MKSKPRFRVTLDGYSSSKEFTNNHELFRRWLPKYIKKHGVFKGRIRVMEE